jgi:glycosyltransferase involved in cell wall biosynthesis
MIRLAWLTPLPPRRSGIAAYSADLLPLLAGEFAIDVFLDDPAPDERAPAPPAPAVTLRRAHELPWRALRDPYDLIVYQLGNAPCHDYMWPYLLRHPGLTVLHDGQLHHARAARLLTRGLFAEYRAELACCHPDAPPLLPEYAIAGWGGPLHYLWPMLRIAAGSAGRVAVHNPWLAAELGDRLPGLPVDTIAMGVPDPQPREPASLVRRRLAIPQDALVVAAFGLVTPEKRIAQAIRAVAALPRSIDARLLLVGDEAAHYDAREDARRGGIANRVILTGYVPDESLAAYIAAADVCLCLRWPSSRETSASWLRALAAGKPTIVTDLAHTADVPTLDPRTWQVLHAPAGGAPPAREAVAVSLDILDEDHSLRVALARLAMDRQLREELGTAARKHWAREHTAGRMAGDYRRVIQCAIEDQQRAGANWSRGGPPRLPDLPAHLTEDGTALARRLLADFGLRLPW